LFAVFIDSFADAEWQQNGSWEYYNDDVVDNHDDDEQQQNGSWEYYNNNNDHDHEDHDDKNELLQNGASTRNYNDVESEAVDSNSWVNIIDGIERDTRTDVGVDDFNNDGHIMPETRPAKKPNILLILADDVGQGDIEYYWKSGLVQMPNIESLGRTGVTFYDVHSTPLCAPSRYMLLSGNYAHLGQFKGGTWGITGEQNQFLKYQKSIAEALKEGGNYSMLFEMDKAVGSLVRMIDERDLAEDTIIIFTSDNGGIRTSHSSQYFLPLLDFATTIVHRCSMRSD
jgi:hypothetical protein